tara:strand:+ start:548 stop:850 length:303 start_codon:yes stop_codon:yes gene_type:complete
MYSFERFIERGNIKIQAFLTEIGVKSDEELREYCSKNNMTNPVQSYFPADVAEEKVVSAKPKPKPITRKKEKVLEKEEETKPAPKPKTTKRRTRRKTEDK